MANREVIYRYSGRPWLAARNAAVCACMAVVVGGIWSLSTEPGSMFYGHTFRGVPSTLFHKGVALFFALCTLLFTMLALNGLLSSRRLVLTARSVKVPATSFVLDTRERTVEHADIRSVERTKAGKDPIIRIEHAGGRLDIESLQMRSHKEFEELFTLLLGSLELAYRARDTACDKEVG